MLASIPSASLLGATGIPVRVEVHVGKGLPGFRIVGQPDPACRESRDRVRAAVMSAGHDWPSKAITVNLAPSGPAQGRGRARPGDRRRRAHRHRAAPGRLRRRPRVRRRARPRRDPAAGAGGRADGRGPRRRRRGRAGRGGRRGARRRSAGGPRGHHARRGGGGAARRRAVPRSTPARSTTSTNRRLPTSPTCAGSPSPDGRSRSPRPAVTTCSWSGRPARARRCWRSASAGCCRRSIATTRSPRRWSTRRPGWPCHEVGSCHARRSVPRTTRRPRSPWSGVARRRSVLARSPSATAACCSSTSSASSRPSRWTACASRSRRASSGWRGPTPAPCSRPGSSSSRRRTRARAVGGHPAGASATTSPAFATCAACPDRCSIASTCASRCSGRRSTRCCNRAAGRTPRRSRPGSPRPARSPSSAPGGSTPRSTASCSTPTPR